MIQESKCSGCGFAFSSSSRQFFCCDPSLKYCIICRRRDCPTCGRLISKELQLPRCRQCYTVAKQLNQMLEEPECQSFYCSKCIITKVVKNSNNYPVQPVTFPCGHAIEANKIEKFLSNYCSLCGNPYDSLLDYDLVNGQKCCFLCLKYEGELVRQFLITCMNCQDIIKRMDLAGAVDNDFILCSKCTTFSQIEERHFSEIQFQDKGKKEDSFRRAPQKMEQNQKNSYTDTSIRAPESSHNGTKTEIKQIQSQKQFPPQANNGKPKMQRDPNEMLKRTILQKFPSDRDLPLPKMKKHLSMETFVEGMEITIEEEKENILKCQQCDYEIVSGGSYSDENGKKLCRLCYAITNNAENLGFSGRASKMTSLDESRRRFQSGEKHGASYLNPSFQSRDQKFGKQSGQFDNYHKLSSTTQPSTFTEAHNIYRESCTLCKTQGQPVIRTVKNGNVCFTCYYKKKQ